MAVSRWLFPDPGFPNTKTFSFRSRKLPSSSVRNCRAAFAGKPLQIESLAATSPAAAPSLSAAAAPGSSAAARIPARSLPADTARSSASLVPPAAPCLRSTPAPSAGADPSGAPVSAGLYIPAALIAAPPCRCNSWSKLVRIHRRHFHHRHRRMYRVGPALRRSTPP